MVASMLGIPKASLEGKSWFYFSGDYEGKWPLPRDSSMTKSKGLINTPEIIVLVRWGVYGLALADSTAQNRHVRAKH
jgi:hypothetical protein